MRTDEQIIQETNELARYLLAELIGTGYEVPDDHKFYLSEDPRSTKAWEHAVRIMEMTTKTEMADVLATILETPDTPVLRTYGVRLWATFRAVAEDTVEAFSFDEAMAKAKTLDHDDFNFKIEQMDGDQSITVYGPADEDTDAVDEWDGDGAEIDKREPGEPFSWEACQLVKDLAKLGEVVIPDTGDTTLTVSKELFVELAALITRARSLCTKEG